MEHDLDTLRHHFENDHFAANSGMRLVELRPGFAKTSRFRRTVTIKPDRNLRYLPTNRAAQPHEQ
jgi:hypothetical protein